MKKIWDFEGNGTNYVGDVYDLLKKYRDGLNKQQDVLKATIDTRITADSEALLIFYIGYVTIFEVIVHYTGDVSLKVNYYNKQESLKLNIDNLEDKLDSIVSSEEMGSVVSYLIKIEKLRK